jgi:predicted esterase
MTILSVPTSTHGRVLVEEAADPSSPRLLVAFHGYGQSADAMMADVRRIPGAERWRIASVQGLHRFYNRDSTLVLASWMTRQDRELAIADNIAYVDRVLDALAPDAAAPIVYLGFSQGVAMAYRAAAFGRRRAAGIIALAGDVPPDVLTSAGAAWPPVLIGAGDRDTWYTPAKIAADEAALESRGVRHQVVRFAGGHLWTDEFRTKAGEWMGRL